MTMRDRLATGVRSMYRVVGHPEARGWADYSHLFLISDSPDWVLEWEMREIGAIARSMGIATAPGRLLKFASRQSLFYASYLNLLLGRFPPGGGHRLATAYFHGRPGSGVREFDEAFARLRAGHQRIDRVQVSHAEMRDVVLSSGIDPAKVFLIRIAVNPSFFPRRTDAARIEARRRLNLPDGVPVVGSLQKDGVGWGEGLEPKLVKGPDTFLRVIERLHAQFPDLHVVLSGPARGYVKRGLDALKVPYRHDYVAQYPELWRLYHALDVYLVTSRQEGGPKAVLESMSCGVPLVSTRVGQATDLVRHGVNGWLADVDDVDGLAHWAAEVLSGAAPTGAVVTEAVETAAANTYDAQRPLWRAFFDGFVA
jgi:glycosyltransferase involved in cell wall biosynthesis